MRPCTWGAGLPAPEQAPAWRCQRTIVGYDEGKMLAPPASAESAREDPQQLVPEAKPTMRSASSRTGEHRELMPQERVLKHQILVWARRGSHGCKQERE